MDTQCITDMTLIRSHLQQIHNYFVSKYLRAIDAHTVTTHSRSNEITGVFAQIKHIHGVASYPNRYANTYCAIELSVPYGESSKGLYYTNDSIKWYGISNMFLILYDDQVGRMHLYVYVYTSCYCYCYCFDSKLFIKPLFLFCIMQTALASLLKVNEWIWIYRPCIIANEEENSLFGTDSANKTHNTASETGHAGLQYSTVYRRILPMLKDECALFHLQYGSASCLCPIDNSDNLFSHNDTLTREVTSTSLLQMSSTRLSRRWETLLVRMIYISYSQDEVSLV